MMDGLGYYEAVFSASILSSSDAAISMIRHFSCYIGPCLATSMITPEVFETNLAHMAPQADGCLLSGLECPLLTLPIFQSEKDDKMHSELA